MFNPPSGQLDISLAANAHQHSPAVQAKVQANIREFMEIAQIAQQAMHQQAAPADTTQQAERQQREQRKVAEFRAMWAAAKQAKGQAPQPSETPPPAPQPAASRITPAWEQKAQKKVSDEPAWKLTEEDFAAYEAQQRRREATAATYAAIAKEAQQIRPAQSEWATAEEILGAEQVEKMRVKRGQHAGSGGAADLFDLLLDVAHRVADYQGLSHSVSQVMYLLPVELVADELGVSEMTVWRYTQTLKELRVLAEFDYITTATVRNKDGNGYSRQPACAGKVWAVSLRPGHRAKITKKDKQKKWRDLDRDISKGRTARQILAQYAENLMLGLDPHEGTKGREALAAFAVGRNPLQSTPPLDASAGEKTVHQPQPTIYNPNNYSGQFPSSGTAKTPTTLKEIAWEIRGLPDTVQALREAGIEDPRGTEAERIASLLCGVLDDLGSHAYWTGQLLKAQHGGHTYALSNLIEWAHDKSHDPEDTLRNPAAWMVAQLGPLEIRDSA